MEALQSTYDEVNKLWLGYKSTYPFDQDVYLGEKIIESLKADPERLLQISHEEQKNLYAGEFLTSIIRVAQNLTNLGIKSKDVVGIVCLNSNAVSIAINGCILIGAPMNTIDPMFTVKEISHMFNQTRPKLVICDFDVYDNVKSALDSIKSDAMIFTTKGRVEGVKCFDDEILRPTGVEDEFVSPKFDEIMSQKIVGIVCSSGTTGFSKGVCLTHGFFMPFYVHYNAQPPSRSLTFSTPYWSTGFYPCITLGFPTKDVRILTSQRFNADLVTELVEKYEITKITLPTSQVTGMVQSTKFTKPKNSLKSILIVGSTVSSTLRENFKKRFPDINYFVVYTMSESLIILPYGEQKEGSVGRIINANSEIKIVDDDGNRLGVGQAGELRIRNPVKFLGYYGNPEATAEAFDEEGFLISGDIGYFDEDRYLFIVDRKKEILKYRGFQYNPTEIESVIEQIEGVKMVCVFGVQDDLLDDIPTAMIIREKGYEEIVTEESVKKFVQSKLSCNKNLYGRVFFTNQLPMTASGKIQRRKVREIGQK